MFFVFYWYFMFSVILVVCVLVELDVLYDCVCIDICNGE